MIVIARVEGFVIDQHGADTELRLAVGVLALDSAEGRVLPIKKLDKMNFLLNIRPPETNRAPVVAYPSQANRYQN